MNEQSSPSRSRGGCTVIALFVIGLGILFTKWNDSKRANAPVVTSPESANPRSMPEVRMSLVLTGWSKGEFGTAMVANFILENRNEFAVKDVTVACHLSGKSGTEIDTVAKTIYESIPAGKSKTFNKVGMGFINEQSARAHCEIVRASVYSP